MIVMGCDPGVSGAVAFINTKTGEGWGELLDTRDGAAIQAAIDAHKPSHVGVEKVSSSPQMGVATSFKFGAAYGSVVGVVRSCLIPLHMVTPRAWQALAFKGRTKPKAGPGVDAKDTQARDRARKARKDAVLEAARDRWPRASLKRKKDGALADALFIALATAKEVQG